MIIIDPITNKVLVGKGAAYYVYVLGCADDTTMAGNIGATRPY